MLSFKSAFLLSSFTLIKRLFSSSSLSTIRMVSSSYLRLLICLLAVLIPACDSLDVLKHQSGTDPALLKTLQSLILQRIGSQGSTLVDWPPLTPSCRPCSPLSRLPPHRLFPELTGTPGLLLSPRDLCLHGALSRFSRLPPSYHFPNILLKVFFSEKSFLITI